MNCSTHTCTCRSGTEIKTPGLTDALMDVTSPRTNTSQIVLPETFILWHLNEKAYIKNKPAIIFLIFSMIVGSVGNGLVIYVYGWRLRPNSSKNIFITWLAVFDLVSCCVTIPFEIFDLRFPMLYGEGVICKISRTFAFAVNITSGLILVLIAFDRLQITRPPYKSYTKRKTRCLILLVTMISLVVSIPALFVFGTKTVTTIFPGIYGKDCSYDDSIRDTMLPVIYYILLAVIFVFTFTILGILYIKIAIAIYEWKHAVIGDAHALSLNNGRKTSQSSSGKSDKVIAVTSKTSEQANNSEDSFVSQNDRHLDTSKYIELSSSNDQENSSTHKHFHNLSSSKQRYEVNIASSTKSTKSSISEHPNDGKRKLSVKERASPVKSNVLFIVITVVFVLSYLPFLLFELLKGVLKEGTFDETAFEIVTKSVYLNNLVNPVIYGIYNVNYREEIRNLFCPRSTVKSRYRSSISK